MASYKVCLTLTVLWISVNADFYSDRFKSLARNSHDHPFQGSFGSIDRDDFHEFASSDHFPSYSSFSRVDGPTEPRDFLVASGSKKSPREDKHFKKSISPFYTITDKDSDSYKDIVLKSGVPYCQEIKRRPTHSEQNGKSGKGSMICYKCKNPKNGAMYEQCSYRSQPIGESGSKNGDDFIDPPSLRNRRSNADDTVISATSFRSHEDHANRKNPYRFSDKLFSDASEDVPAEYKNKDEKCEKVVKDSMVCMVCKDAKTNGKYEQCSYVRQPTEKSYAYSKSNSYNQPKKQKNDDEEDEGNEKGPVDREYADSKPVLEHREYSYPEKHYEKQSEKSDDEGSSGEETSSNCKKVQKDSKTCTVCKDPKTGGNYEKCSYAYQPNDKVYQFSRSKSFGYPSNSSPKDSKSSNYQEKHSEDLGSHPEESSDYSRDYTIPEYYSKHSDSRPGSYFDREETSGYHQAPSTDSKSISYKDDDDHSSDYEKSESERLSENVDASNCKEIQKDSKVCKVCKDPKTGSNFEQCTYKYQPHEKLYSYSKSSKSGNPKEAEDRSYGESKIEKPSVPRYDEGKSYEFSTDKKPYVAASDTKREFHERPTPDESKSEITEKSSGTKKVPTDFYEAFKKKAEIEKYLKEFQQEDRSNCKKITRDKMTCYQCVDEKGFQKEECAFITAEEPSNDKLAYREVKEFQESPIKKVPRSTMIKNAERRVDNFPLEPEASASENRHTKGKKPVNESAEDEDSVENSKEEPYDYASETRPVFDKVLGLTLPAYMLSTSEHEAEFDDAVSSGRI